MDNIKRNIKVVDDDNVEALLKQINDEIKKIEYPRIQIKVNNGNYYIEFSVYTNIFRYRVELGNFKT